MDAPDGLHPARGEAPPADGRSAEAAFVRAEDPDRTRVGGGNRLLERFMPRGLADGDGRRLFGVARARPVALGSEALTHKRIQGWIIDLHAVGPPHPLTQRLIQREAL